jgi:hypothetical protein
VALFAQRDDDLAGDRNAHAGTGGIRFRWWAPARPDDCASADGARM